MGVLAHLQRSTSAARIADRLRAVRRGIASASLFAALVGCAAAARADVIAPWDQVPSGLCPVGTRQFAHGGECIVRTCDPAAPGARCARVRLCVTSTGRGHGPTYLVASSTCSAQSDCPPVSDCTTLDVVPGRDPPVTQGALGCCALCLVGAAAAALVLARSRHRARDARDPASASRDGRVG